MSARGNGPMQKAPKKADLPTKTCAACGRPFTWRKKWRATWDEVRFCSDACRTGRHPHPKP